jgi:hypothetical protein
MEWLPLKLDSNLISAQWKESSFNSKCSNPLPERLTLKSQNFISPLHHLAYYLALLQV